VSRLGLVGWEQLAQLWHLIVGFCEFVWQLLKLLGGHA
jgi:hypothetical protein